MDKTNVIATVIMSIAIGYVFAILIILLSADNSVCTKAGYETVGITSALTLTCVHKVVVPYSDVLSELDET